MESFESVDPIDDMEKRFEDMPSEDEAMYRALNERGEEVTTADLQRRIDRAIEILTGRE